ncbi:FKBP-type peptidyl-prolyl cis-trans isomerase [Pedobacter sp. Leaf176]|uniref:FKBP-type peptidyl-prolyl cis-trans isomerase n=1 Tax=Pedobacter sp. Leaf176 TaxID=1736286 RepID=UPI0006F1FC8B|nr:FKBP-type peptidyl-prolyl cis-trans isomerase [Pedobacter sp. Leaf176]KQR72320.1 peptidylprolyl isomerase [Pedobacter sp. Leaf176]
MSNNFLKFTALSFLLISVLFTSCKKDEDAEKQIAEFIQKNNITATKHPSGLYYQIIKAGTGNSTYPPGTKITIKYVGKLLNGTVIDDGNNVENTFQLAQLIEGWRIGIPLIQKGGEIRLIIPSELAYGSQATGPVPANSVLDFTIQLINVQ